MKEFQENGYFQNNILLLQKPLDILNAISVKKHGCQLILKSPSSKDVNSAIDIFILPIFGKIFLKHIKTFRRNLYLIIIIHIQANFVKPVKKEFANCDYLYKQSSLIIIILTNYYKLNMGVYRSIPENHINFHSQQHSNFQFAIASTCGWKIYQEDFFFHYKHNPKIYCIGILDGHCGPQVAKFCQKQIPLLMKNNQLLKIGQFQAAIQNICQSLDQRIRDCPEKINTIRKKYQLPELPENCQTQSGTSLALCLITDQQVIIGNIGECKCYVSYKQNQSKAVLISGNHTVSNSQEYERVQKAQGFFLNHLVNGKFSFTRSIGDLLLKNQNDQSKSILIATPSVFCLRPQDLRLLIIGSSGFWQQPQKVLKQVLSEDLQFNELKSKLNGLVQDLIAKQIHKSQDPYGKNNITAGILHFY